MEISVFGPDKTAYGPFPYSDPEDDAKERNERGRAVAVLKNGNVVVAGEREATVPNTNIWFTRGVALLFEGKGKFLGEWTSSGDKLENDAILAAVATDEGFATCGYTNTPPDDPGSKKQILPGAAARGHGAEDHVRANVPCDAGYPRPGSVMAHLPVGSRILPVNLLDASLAQLRSQTVFKRSSSRRKFSRGRAPVGLSRSDSTSAAWTSVASPPRYMVAAPGRPWSTAGFPAPGTSGPTDGAGA